MSKDAFHLVLEMGKAKKAGTVYTKAPHTYYVNGCKAVLRTWIDDDINYTWANLILEEVDGVKYYCHVGMHGEPLRVIIVNADNKYVITSIENARQNFKQRRDKAIRRDRYGSNLGYEHLSRRYKVSIGYIRRLF